MKRESLPLKLTTPRTIIQQTSSDDLKFIASWPLYPKHYECFDMIGNVAVSPDGRYWWEKLDVTNRLHYSVILPSSNEVIGIYVFTRIDWEESFVGNMGIRLRADLCNKGLGQETFKPLLQAILNSGMKTIRLDVAATNTRAIKCYEKSGMKIVNEFFNNHDGDIDFNDPHWQDIKHHFKIEDNKIKVRFYYMEITDIKAEQSL